MCFIRNAIYKICETKMKIIHILHSTDALNGSGKAFLSLLAGLMGLGVEPLVIVPDNKGLCDTLLKMNVPFRVLSYKMAVYPSCMTVKTKLLFLPILVRRILLNVYSARKLTRIAKDFAADIIHTNVSVINIGYKAARRLGIPHVWHIREYGALDFYYYYYYTRSMHLRKYHQPNSYQVCITKDIRRYNGLDNSSRTRVIYDGVLPRAAVRFSADKKPYFLFAGRLEENKGIKDAILAFACFLKANPTSSFRLKIAGDTPDVSYKQTLVKLADDNGISDRVDFLGMRSDVYDLMYEAYALLVPSYSEGFGFITAEAMFNGCLVIGRDIAGTKEQFDNGFEHTGKEIALRFNTIEEMAERMSTVVTEGIESYFPMIYRSQSVVSDLYSIEKHVDSVYSFYGYINGCTNKA